MSHHSSVPGDESEEAKAAREALSGAMKGIFGEFPAGKLNVEDEGALALIVRHENGKVILQFPKPVAWLGFDAQGAVELAQSLITHARAVSTGILTVVIGPKP